MSKTETSRPVEIAALSLYGLLWRLSLPLLRRNRRLATGFESRRLKRPLKKNAHIWLQAASAGEAYLVWELLKRLSLERRLAAVLTTNTRQGREILEAAVASINKDGPRIEAQVTYFPFDMPSIMEKAVSSIDPRVMVLLETEIWPGLLSALRSHACPAVIVNGRITAKSLSRYSIWPSFWRSVRPEQILAISDDDADRFGTLFGKKGVATMPNIKFDRVQRADPAGGASAAFQALLKPGMNFAVLGSVRQAEESDVENILLELARLNPDIVVGLFPRHLHRVRQWQNALDRLGLPWVQRSRLTPPAKAGQVVLWDIFGELGTAYQHARAAFVGGSLAPLGGQNFLEPLQAGLKPVIGPHWQNFTWIGSQIIDQGLVLQADSWQDVARMLGAEIADAEDKETVRQRATAYIRQRQGGTRRACELIMKYL